MSDNVEPLRFEPKEEDIIRPLVVPIDGKDYAVGGESGRVTTEMLQRSAEIGQNAKDGDSSLSKMVALLLCVPEDTFVETDFRLLRSVNEWITEQVFPDLKKVSNKNKAKTKRKAKNK